MRLACFAAALTSSFPVCGLLICGLSAYGLLIPNLASAQVAEVIGADLIPLQPTNASNPFALPRRPEVAVMMESQEVYGVNVNVPVTGPVPPPTVGGSFSCANTIPSPNSVTLVHSAPDTTRAALVLVAFQTRVTGLVLYDPCLEDSDWRIRPADAAEFYPQFSPDREVGSGTSDRVFVTDDQHFVGMRLNTSDTDLDQLRLVTEAPINASMLQVDCGSAAFNHSGNSSFSSNLSVRSTASPTGVATEPVLLVELPRPGTCLSNGSVCESIDMDLIAETGEDIAPFRRFLRCQPGVQLPVGNLQSVMLRCSWPGALGPVITHVLGGVPNGAGDELKCRFDAPSGLPDGGLSDGGFPNDASVTPDGSVNVDAGLDAGRDAGGSRDAGSRPEPGFQFEGGGSCSLGHGSQLWPPILAMWVIWLRRRRSNPLI